MTTIYLLEQIPTIALIKNGELVFDTKSYAETLDMIISQPLSLYKWYLRMLIMHGLTNKRNLILLFHTIISRGTAEHMRFYEQLNLPDILPYYLIYHPGLAKLENITLLEYLLSKSIVNANVVLKRALKQGRMDKVNLLIKSGAKQPKSIPLDRLVVIQNYIIDLLKRGPLSSKRIQVLVLESIRQDARRLFSYFVDNGYIKKDSNLQQIIAFEGSHYIESKYEILKGKEELHSPYKVPKYYDDGHLLYRYLLRQDGSVPWSDAERYRSV